MKKQSLFALPSQKHFEIIFVLCNTLICAILWFIPTGFENPSMTKSSLRERAIVLEVDNDDLQATGIVTVGTQDLTIQILSGPFRGHTIAAKNVLMGQMNIDRIFEVGDKVLAILQLSPDRDCITSARADNLYRVHIELLLFGLFALFLIAFAGWTGLKALLSFVLTALAIWKILIPLLLKGYSPIPAAFLIVSGTTTCIILLISGFTRKGVVALSGAIAGVGLTTILAVLFGYFFRIPGTVQEFSETLLYAGFLHLRISHIFLASIFISASGAVMDVAMDIASAQNEIVQKRPDISARELTISGFRIAKPVIGTMTTTLLFAYSGSFMFTFMIFMAKGTPMIYIFNINYIAAEILHTLVGSFGLVLVAPITALIGGSYYHKEANTPH